MARTDMIGIVAAVADYIEEHIREKIVLDDIAEAVNLSKYHLHRLFKAVTNRPLMSYVRARKLSHSLDLLARTDLRILDIAMEYCFSHEQSYTRAFNDFFQVSPAVFRKERPALAIQEKIDPESLQAIGAGILTQPSIVFKPEFHLIGIRTLVEKDADQRDHTANRLGREFYYNHGSGITNAVRPWVYIGLVRYIAGDDARTYYMPSLEVRSLDRIPDGMVGETIPAGKYAVFKYIGPFHPDRVSVKDLASILAAMKLWLDNSAFSQAGDYHFESIDSTVAREDYCEVDLHLPIN